VNKIRIFSDASRGASMVEVLLSLAIVAMAAPFVYNRIAQTNRNIDEMAAARDITALRGAVLNFVRMNQAAWPDAAQIKLSDAELDEISGDATAVFIDKYMVQGAVVADAYLSFDAGDALRANRIARYIGADAAVVGADGVAYADTWAVAAPDFKPGNIIYRISRSAPGDERTKYLHRAASGDDGLNIMMRDLHMGGFNVLNVGRVSGASAKVGDAVAPFAEADEVNATNVYFRGGANMDGGKVKIGDMRVAGDITGFRNIYADNLNGEDFTTKGRIIADRATISKSVNVARDLVLKSDTARSVGGFDAIEVNSVAAPYLYAEEMIFFENAGLTVSGELLVSTSTPPLKIGSWVFPSASAPRFDEFSLQRAARPAMPVAHEFDLIIGAGWRAAMPKEAGQ